MLCYIDCFQKHTYYAESPPIMLGPLFLHWDGCTSTYQRFFSHLRTKLDCDINTEVGTSDIVIGSDEEKAILKVIKQSFPNAMQLLCQRHLEENARRHLQTKIGVPDKVKNTIISAIFGARGLTNSEDMVDFELRYLSLANELLDIAPNFMDYFEQYLIPRLREHVMGPKAAADWIPLHWTNNNCELLNNIIKLSTNCKTLKLPDLISKLHAIVKLQYADMRGALHGQGNYQIIPAKANFIVPHAI